jgi:hypothetical protein
MDATRLLPRLITGLSSISTCDGLFLSGSHARGTEDAFSDLDLVVVSDPVHHPFVADQIRVFLGTIAPLVLFRASNGPTATLINAITADWDRIDLLLEAKDRFLNRASDSVRPLHDPTCLADGLRLSTEDTAQLGRRIAYTTEEFLRVLGLLPVGLGRQEYLLCTLGAGHLRDHLITLMKAKAGTLGEGALHLSRSISATDMTVLIDLPVSHPNRDSVIAAHLALARVFLPRAQALHSHHQLVWPQAFETATKAHLSRTLAIPADALW